MNLTVEQRSILRLLHSARGHVVDALSLPPETAPAMADLVERGLIWRGPGGGVWLTENGQAIVDAEA